MILFDDSEERSDIITMADDGSPAVIKVVGVGGGGCNAINRMIAAGVKGVEFIAVNTDGQALQSNAAGMKIQLITPNGRGKALGAGCDPEAAHKAALDRTDELVECLEGADMVFIAAGMGGGTGTGAAPVIGTLARNAGALTVAVVTKPFAFEGTRKARISDKGIDELRGCVDTLISVPNSRLLQMVGPQVSVQEAFKLADEALRHGVQGISDIINETGIINRDFADVETVMRGGGMALMGIGVGEGEHRAVEAAQQAFSSPLLEETSLEGAQRVLVNFVGGPATTISEINDAAELIAGRCAEDCLFIFGYGQRDDLADTLQVTVIATGFGNSAEDRPATRRSERSGAKVPMHKSPSDEQAPGEAASPFLPAELPPGYGINVGDFSEYDIPTYLRRQLDRPSARVRPIAARAEGPRAPIHLPGARGLVAGASPSLVRIPTPSLAFGPSRVERFSPQRDPRGGGNRPDGRDGREGVQGCGPGETVNCHLEQERENPPSKGLGVEVRQP